MAIRRPAPGGVPSYKLVLLGESAVGKSSIVLRFVRNDFDDYRESTIGAAFLSQTTTLENGQQIKFEIWDTAGQERYKSLAPMYYRSARVAVVVYDITSDASLEKAKAWIKELQRQADPNIIICLAGNKADLTDRREVSTEAAQNYASEENALFYETSAKSGEGVTEMFNAIAEKLAASSDPPPSKPAGIALEQKSSIVEGCSC